MNVLLNDTYRSIIVNSFFIILLLCSILSIIGHFAHLSGIVVLSFLFSLIYTVVFLLLYQIINSKIIRAKEAKSKFFILNQSHGEPQVLFRDEHTLGSNATFYELAKCNRSDFDPASGLVNPDVERSGNFVKLAPGDYLSPQKNSNILDLLGDLESTPDPKISSVRNDTSKLEYEQRKLYNQINDLKKENKHLLYAKNKEQTKRHDIELDGIKASGQFVDPWRAILNATNDLSGAYSGISEDMKELQIKTKGGKIDKKAALQQVIKSATSTLESMKKGDSS